MPNIEPLQIKQPEYLHDCDDCGNEFLLRNDAPELCPRCGSKRVEPSERSE